ncbi:MAG: cholesterol oxidase [Frankiales bacterium]|jgi:cholesterol oxidase|nr:cholesterol oxidase [Frankiales bacterium]
MGGSEEYDVLVVGSGFGGSVAALRLTEKGYRVGVVEAGRRWTAETLPKTSWDISKFLWAPRLGLKGIQRITLLKDVLVLSGAGVGGGSLVYANTLYEPPPTFFDDVQWRDITDWHDELSPYYEQAKRMLGVTTYPGETAADLAMKRVAERFGKAETYHATPVGVFFGEGPGITSPDPYFGGAGPERTGCRECGNCMIGCRFGAKNRLDVNYLYLAEKGGATILPETTVTAIRQLADGTWAVDVTPTGKHRGGQTLSAKQVVLAAGALGTQRLLHEMKHRGALPRLSGRLGELTRTNSEAILGAKAKDSTVDYSKGVAITSSWHPDEHTHIEPVRYGKGSNAMGLLQTILVDGGGKVPRPLRFIGSALRHPILFLRNMSVRRWSERTVIALVMQTFDNSITVRRKRGLLGSKLTTAPGHGEPNPSWIPVAHDAVRALAEEVDGQPGGTWGDVFNVPMTAHIIGGCVIGESPETGVIDPYHRVHGYPTLHVVDGAAISANLGVNPSLTITAQAERAFALWPNEGEVDTRPSPGSAYSRVHPTPPRLPMVPAGAPGALRLPLLPQPVTRPA